MVKIEYEKNSWSEITIRHETDCQLSERLKDMAKSGETPGRTFALLEAARRLVDLSQRLGISWRD